MAIEFCPLAEEVGNLADWFSVGVGAVAAVATTVVAGFAYKTSKRATDIAEEAKGIALQQHEEAVANRKATERIVVALLMHEVSELPVQIGILIQRCDRKVPVDSEGELTRPDIFEFARALGGSSGSLMPGTEQVLDRIHTLQDEVGDKLAALVGYSRTLSQMSKDFSQFIEIGFPTAKNMRERLIYTGNERDIAVFRTYLANFLGLAIDFANEFRRHGGHPAHDYSKFERLITKDQ